MKYRDREWLYEEFYVKKRKARDIGEECGVGQDTITEYARRFGITALRRQYADNLPYKDRNWLYEEYYVKRRTSKDIAEECGVDYNTINTYAKKFGILDLIRKDSAKRPFEDRDWLYVEAFVKKRTVKDISAECGVSASVISKRLKNFGISEIIQSESSTPLYKDRDWLYEMYYVRRMSSPEIADQCGVSRNAIHRYVKKLDIPNQKPALEEEVELLCNSCKKPFTRTLRNVLQRVRNNSLKLCCSKTCAATIKMTDPTYADNLQKANLRFKESDEGKASMRAVAIKSNLKQAANRGRTSIEQKLAEELERRNILYVEQYKVGERFLADFYLPDYNAILEADGRFWHSSPKAIEKDKRKNAYIRSCGYNLYRFWDDEINEDVSACVDTIFERGLHDGEVKTDERA